MKNRIPKSVFVVVTVVALVNVALWQSVQADRAYIKDLAAQIAPEGLSDRQIVVAMTDYVHENVHKCTTQDVASMPLLRRWNYLYNPFRPGPRPILEYGTHHLGPCQSNTRALSELLKARGVKVEKVVMHDDELRGIHSVLEVEYDGRRGVVSPSFGILYQHSDGSPATLTELRDDHELFLANAKRGWQYGWGPDAKSQKLPLPYDLYRFDNAYYFNYNWFGPARWIVFRFLRGAFGMQALYWLTRPGWYTYPANTILICLDAMVLTIFALRWIRWRRNGPRTSGDPDSDRKAPERRREPVTRAGRARVPALALR